MRFVDRMHDRGWTADEIQHALTHIEHANSQKHPAVRFVEKAGYWLYLFAIIVTVAVCSAAFYPFFSLFPAAMQPIAYLTVGVVSALFGLLFAHVLHHIDELEHHHHAFALFVAAASAIIAGWYFSGTHLLSYGVTYAACFSIFYSFYWWRR